MDSSYQSHWYPMDPGSPDSTSPIPDEYAYRNKGDEADKEYISLERSAGLFSIPNESSFDLSSQNSQFARIQPNRSRDNSQGVIRQPGLAVPQQESTITARSVASEQHHRIDPGSSESKPVTQTPVFKTPTPGRSVVQFPEYFGRLTDNPASTCTRPQYHRFSPIHNMTSSPESRSQSSDSSTKPSVKHLTCWWWYEKGQCRYSESECLYAHHDTGLVADAPRQVKPGEPAIAGRSLDRALRQAQQELGQGEKGTAVGGMQGLVGKKTPTQTATHEENRLLRAAYETLFAATTHSLETTTQFRRAFSKFSQELQSADKASYAAAANITNTDSFCGVEGRQAGGTPTPRLRPTNVVSIQELASSMRGIEQKSLESGAAEYDTRAKISSIENMLGEAGMEDLVQGARVLAKQQK